MALKLLKPFQAVAQEGSISKAARRLFITQPAVTRLIKELEESVGCRLFYREHNGVTLTTEGRVLLGYANIILGLYEEALSALRNGNSEDEIIKIGFSATSLMPYIANVINEFRSRHTSIAFRFYDLNYQEQLNMLQQCLLDIALVSLPGNLSKYNVDSCVIMKLKAYAAVPKAHKLANKKSVKLRELQNDYFIGFVEDMFPARNKLIQKACHLAGFEPKLLTEANGFVALLAMISAGVGVGVLSKLIGEAPNQGVVFLDIEEDIPPIEYACAFRRNDTRAAVHSVIGMLKERLHNFAR